MVREDVITQKEIDIFLRFLRSVELTSQQRKTFRGQALAGDLMGAMKGLQKKNSSLFVKTCPVCEARFMTKKRNKKYCSRECADDMHLEAVKQKNVEKRSKRKAKKGMETVETGKLDEWRAEAKERGMTYGELKRLKALEAARVQTNETI